MHGHGHGKVIHFSPGIKPGRPMFDGRKIMSKGTKRKVMERKLNISCEYKIVV